MIDKFPRIASAAALVLFAAGVAGVQAMSAQSVAADIMKTDEAYRLAKLNRDIKTLDRILADGFNETNQNGNTRDKAQTLELWASFTISSLTTDTSQVRIAGTTALVTGTQTENGTERMLFTRVFVRGPAGWQLLASMQFRNPNPPAIQSIHLQGVEGEVMKADEAFRLAKLNRDTSALGQILADGFNETNQNGNSYNKTQIIDLFKSFTIDSLTTDTFKVRVTGNTAMVIGTQTEGGNERMLFTRAYVNGPAGWQLLASMQFRNPNVNSGL